MAMVNQASSPGLTQRPPRAPKTPISRRKSITDKLDMDLAKEDLRRDDAERLEELIENLASWLTQLLGIPITSDTFLETMRDGVILCTVANKIHRAAVQYRDKHNATDVKLPAKGIGKFHKRCQPLSFHARENITKFVRWAAHFGVGEALLFNSEDLIMGDGKMVALCLQAIARKTKLFIPTLDFEVSKMVAVLRDLGTLLGTNLDPKADSTHRDKIMDAMISERGFWRGIHQRISDALKSESSVKRDVNQQDMQMLKLLGISQTSRNKMENSIEESRREEMFRVLQAAAKNKRDNDHIRLLDRESSISETDEFDSTAEEICSDQSQCSLEEQEVIEVKPRAKYQFVKVKVPKSSRKLPPSGDHLLTPEMFFFGPTKPAYEDMSLDMFMQGYTALLNDDRVGEDERAGRMKVLQLIFTHIVRHGWVAMRGTHKKMVHLIQSGDMCWSDDLDQTFDMLLEEQARSTEQSPMSVRSCCSSCGGRTPLRARRTTPLTVVRQIVTVDTTAQNRGEPKQQ